MSTTMRAPADLEDGYLLYLAAVRETGAADLFGAHAPCEHHDRRGPPREARGGPSPTGSCSPDRRRYGARAGRRAARIGLRARFGGLFFACM
jgi:hypothetical protein